MAHVAWKEVTKDVMAKLIGLPPGIKLEAIAETQHGWKIEVSSAQSDPTKMLEGLIQRAVLKGYEVPK